MKTKIGKNGIPAFVNSYFPSREDEDQNFRPYLGVFLAIGIITLLSFSIWHFLIHEYYRSALLLIVCSVQVASLISLQKIKDLIKIKRVNLAILASYLLYLVVIGGGTHDGTIFWMFILPILCCSMLGKTEGKYWNITILLIISFIFLDVFPFIETYHYEPGAKFRFCIVYVIVSISGYLASASKDKYKNILKDKCIRLQQEVNLRIEIEKELKLHQNHLSLLVDEKTNKLSKVNQKYKQAIQQQKLIQKNLKASELKYASLVNQMNEGLVKVDADWNIVYANKSFEQMIGYSCSDLSGKSFYNFISPSFTQIAKQEHQDRFLKETHSYELEILKADGSPFPVLCSPKPEYDENGNYLGGLGVIADISELKKATDLLKKNEERFKFLAENMADIVWTLDMNLYATYVSPSIHKVLGYTAEERKCQKMEDMVTPETFQRIMKTLAVELEREKAPDVDLDRSVSLEVEYYHKDGSIVWMENNIKAIRDQSNTIVGVYGVSHDITERKVAEAEREKLIKELQLTLAEIKTLKGLIPICASCKKIRDDKGYWNLLESYIEKHSEASFSHSMCPECSDKFYGNEDWYIEMKRKEATKSKD